MAGEVSCGDSERGSQDQCSVWPRGGKEYGQQLGHALVLYDEKSSQGGGDCTDIISVIRCHVCRAKEVDQCNAFALAGVADCQARED